MDKFKLKQFKAIEYVKMALLQLNYPENINIQILKDENGIFFYIAYYEQIYNGIMTKYMMPIKKSNFNKLLKLGLEKRGFVVNEINAYPSDDELIYEAHVEIATNTNKLKRVKGRKNNGVH